MMRWIAAFGAAVFMGGLAQAATLYRWVGPNGVVTYQNSPPPSSAAHVRVIRMPNHASPAAVRKAVSAMHPVVLYGAPHCAPCRQVSAYLRRRGVPFRAVDVSRAPSALQDMKTKTGSTTVPTIMVGQQVLVGYIPSALKNELTAAGYPKAPRD